MDIVFVGWVERVRRNASIITRRSEHYLRSQYVVRSETQRFCNLRFSKGIPHFMRRPDFRTPPSFFLVLIGSVLLTGNRKSVQEEKTIAFAIRSVDRP